MMLDTIVKLLNQNQINAETGNEPVKIHKFRFQGRIPKLLTSYGLICYFPGKGPDC